MRNRWHLLGLAAFALLSVGLCAEEKKEGEHVAAHGGCLNAIGACEIGHAELKIEGSVLKMWFVGGGPDTIKSVRVPDAEVTLTFKGTPARTLVLKAKPIELAEETVGNCSYFEGQADWLKDVKEFEASGSVTFKGKKEDLKLMYPVGWDPDDQVETKK